MTVSQFIFKVRFRLWEKLVTFSGKRWFYHYLYRSYWHYILSKKKPVKNTTCYYTARPNPGAGIGHQLGNWITGHWYAQLFDLKFAHLPFSTQRWEDFLGLGEGEVKVADLVKSGYKVRRLPWINDRNPQDIAFTKRIIESYAGKKVVFKSESDQNTDDCGDVDLIKQKFSQAKAREKDQLIYSKENFNIAVHVRRTVVIDGKTTIESKEAQALRWLGYEYYEKVLQRVIDNIQVSQPISIYIFCTEKLEEFTKFSNYGTVQFCTDMDEYTSLLHLSRAKLLVISKSAFSYLAALVNDCIKICPKSFWHDYPDGIQWILADDNGDFNEHQLKQALAENLGN